MIIDKSFHIKLNKFLNNYKFKFNYLDIGSSLPLNKYMRYLEKNFTIHLFEPNQTEAEKLKLKFFRKKNFIINQKAISNKKNLKVNIYDNKNMSSFLKLNKMYKAFHPQCKIIKNEDANSIKLENYIKKNKIYILKVDAQGYSYQCLQSAKKKLQNIPIIITELENYELYKKQKLAHELSDYLYRHDYIQVGNIGSYNKSLIKNNRKKNFYFREITYSNDVIFIKNIFKKRLDVETYILIIIFLTIFNFCDFANYILNKADKLSPLLKKELRRLIKSKMSGNRYIIKCKYKELLMKKISLKKFVENISQTNEHSF